MDGPALEKGRNGSMGIPSVDEEQNLGGKLSKGPGVSWCSKDTLHVVIGIKRRTWDNGYQLRTIFNGL